MTQLTTMKRFMLTLSIVLLPLCAQAETLDPNAYVAVDLAVRETTLAGMAERLALLSGGASTEDRDIDNDLEHQQQVTAIYSAYGTTASDHAAYGTRNDTAIAQWIEDHPVARQQYDALTAEFDALSAQLNALIEGN